jgi:hypothetical protein
LKQAAAATGQLLKRDVGNEKWSADLANQQVRHFRSSSSARIGMPWHKPEGPSKRKSAAPS